MSDILHAQLDLGPVSANPYTDVERFTSLLQENERLFRLAFETAAVGLAVVTLNGRFLQVNRALCDFLEYSAEELTTHTFQELTYPGDLDLNLTLRQEMLDGKRTTYSMEKRYLTRSGQSVWAQLTVSLIRHRSGAPRYLFSVIQDITARKERERQREEAEQTYRILSSRTLEIQEEERGRLAQELHDEIGQALTAVSFYLKALQRHKDAVGLSEQLGECIRITDSALNQVRAMSLDLRPPQLDSLGMMAAVRWLVNVPMRAAGLRVDISTGDDVGLEDAVLSLPVRTACFRIVQEAMTNIMRHAKASRVQIIIRRQNDFIKLEIQDNGLGFDARKSLQGAKVGQTLGLLGMQERAQQLGGTLLIQSTLGEGTYVCATLPLGPKDPSDL